MVKKQSPTLFVMKADIELWFAAILVNQKLTKRYEQTPTPSHVLSENKYFTAELHKYTKLIITTIRLTYTTSQV